MPTHGSLTKAGKVRAQTPKVESIETGGNPIPRIKNRINYLRRIVNAPNYRQRRRR